MLTFAETDKKLAVNKTNMRTIMSLYGPKVGNWGGKKLTLYPATTKFGPETVECIRIRPVAPQEKSNG